MKQSDIFSIIFVASVGVLAAFFICRELMGDPEEKKIDFTAVSKVITADLKQPNPEVFNSTAINPTIEVYVGNCEDIDQNGILDETELQECNRVQTAKDEEEKKKDDDSNDDNDDNDDGGEEDED